MKWIDAVIGMARRVLGRKPAITVLDHRPFDGRRPRGAGYKAKLLALSESFIAMGGTRTVTIWHDPRCRCLRTRRERDCRCDPLLEVGADADRGDS